MAPSQKIYLEYKCRSMDTNSIHAVAINYIINCSINYITVLITLKINWDPITLLHFSRYKSGWVYLSVN